MHLDLRRGHNLELSSPNKPQGHKLTLSSRTFSVAWRGEAICPDHLASRSGSNLGSAALCGLHAEYSCQVAARRPKQEHSRPSAE